MIDLLDTNAYIGYLRQRNSAVIARIAATPASDICLCSVVKAELYHGAHSSQQTRSNLIKVERSSCDRTLVFPQQQRSSRVWPNPCRTRVTRLAIGPYDLQVAAITWFMA